MPKGVYNLRGPGDAMTRNSDASTGVRTLTRSSTLAIILAFGQGMSVCVVRAGVPAQFNLAVGDENVSITGAVNGNHSGFSIASGDVNGDGRVDLIVLSYGAAPLGGTRLGEIDVVWGSTFPAEGNIALGQDSQSIARVFGSTTQPYSSIVSGGDFNNDGRFDILWGQPFGPGPGFTSTDGVVYVIFGSSTFPDTLDIGSNPAQVVTLRGGPWDGGLGASGCGCDLNGDGFDEIVVSAPWYATADVFVIWGGTTFLSSYDMSAPPPGVTRLTDTQTNSGMGWALGCADFDDDEFEDLVMGAPGLGPPNTFGTVTILFGKDQFPTVVSLPNPAHRTKRIHKSPSIGGQVAVGDLNGDTEIDLVASDSGADPFGCNNCGEVYVFLDPLGLPDSVWLDAANPLRLFGIGTNTWHGIGLRMADLTGDNRDDIVVVSKGNYNSPTSLDQTIVVYGSPAPPDSVYLGTDTEVTRIIGPSHDADLGRGLALGDFSGDGVTDLALGAHRVQSNAGKTYVIFGSGILSTVEPTNPQSLSMRQNYPNPFNPATTIRYSISRSTHVHMAVFDVGGRMVATLVDSQQSPGEYAVGWNGLDDRGQEVASGVYFCRLTANQLTASTKMVLLR